MRWCVTIGASVESGFALGAGGGSAANAAVAASATIVMTLARTALQAGRIMGGSGALANVVRKDGGESGIRTHEAVLAPTRFPIVLLQPLGHLSAGAGELTGHTRGTASADSRPRSMGRGHLRALPRRAQLVADLHQDLEV